MHRFLGCVLSVISCLHAGAAFCDSPPVTTVRVHFDLPAQPLARTLKAIGTVTNTDVGFSASQVAGRVAPSLQADLTVDDALLRVLVGTGLRPQHLDDHTIVIAPITATNMPRVAMTGAEPLRLAQVETDTPVPVDQPAAPDKSKSDEGLEEIVVTGSHIRGVAPSSPALIITRDDIDRSGYTSVGDLMRSLPQNYGGGNSPQLTTGAAPGIDNSGSISGGSTPNLRGLGSGSTLTLVNGHRLADDTINGAVDISLIPLAAIERVEVVTDGASAAYGSDAVAGVVNIILKKDFDGSQTSILGGGTAQGGGTEKQVNQLLGKTWSTGGVLFDYEFDRVDPIYSTERDYTLQAGSPTTLYPESSRSSFFVSGHQDIAERVTGFFDGLYTYRIQNYAVTYAGQNFEAASEVDVHQYAADLGLNVVLPGNWQLRPVVDVTEQRSVDVGTSVPFFPTPVLTFEGRTSTFEAVADGPLITLPAGAARAALGGGYRLETFAYLEQGLPATVNAERKVEYVFGELAIPIFTPANDAWIRKLDLNISGREEHSSDFGNAGVPQLGLAYAPSDAVKLRATWGKAYRAPPLFALYSQDELQLQPLANPASATGSSPALVQYGGNSTLRPETARTWTAGVDYDSSLAPGLHIGLTYYDIAYLNRISRIPTIFAALSNPIYAPFVTLSPTAATQQNLINAAGPYFFNITGAPYNPSDVAAIVNNELVNVARQQITGVDLTASYKMPTYHGSVEIFANASYLDLRQQFVPLAPEVEISGQAFEPAKIRTRAGASWSLGPVGVTGILNFTGSETNTYLPNEPHVASWTTFDMQLNFRPQLSGLLAGFQAALSAQNIFDRDPPFVLFDQYVPGLHYDSTNANVLGRFVTIKVSKEFK